MRIYWTSKSVPELAELPAAERKRIVQLTAFKPLRRWQAWVAAILVGAAFVASIELLPRVIPSAAGRYLWFLLLPAFLIAVRHIDLSLQRPYIRQTLEAGESDKGETR